MFAEALAGLPIDRLEAELQQQAANATAAMYRWLLLVAEFDRREAAASWGCRSTAAWLAWRCGVEARTARDHVRVARALGGLPAIAAVFAAGELPYSKVRALTRVATASTQAELLDFARAATTAQLERTIRAYRRAVRDTGDGGPDAARRSVAHTDWDDDAGRLVANLVPEDAAIVFAALDAGAEQLGAEQRESGSAEPLSQRRARVLVEMAEGFVSGRTAEVGDDRYLVLVHATVDSEVATLDNGAPVSADSLAALLCDQSVAPLIRGSDGNPLFLGRTTRTLSRAQRRALKVRDGDGCVFPGCSSRSFLHGHHVRWWERDLGPTDLTNLMPLCTYHHTRVHKGEFTIASDGQGRFVFRRAVDGAVLEPTPASPPAATGTAEAMVAAVAAGYGEQLDLAEATTAMASLFARAG